MNKKTGNQNKARNSYSAQFKDQVLLRADTYGVAQVARDLGVSESMIYAWREKKKSGGNLLEKQKIQQAEMTKLRRENERLSEENAFLKKAATYFTKESK